jgi:nicotinate-nucleotide--dimethylbenzimidazole phosphoribosyltransferase
MLPDWIRQVCPEVSQVHREMASRRQTQLTKPAGSLGRLEALAIDLAAIQNRSHPCADRAPIIIFAADHGIAARGVSAYPQEVTIAMLANFAAGGAAISVLARELGSRLDVIDAGTLAASSIPGVVTDKPRLGSRDFSVESALTAEEARFALECGQRAIERVSSEQPDIVILGEMGIGNTTSSAALAAALLHMPSEAITGNGTGLNHEARSRKAAIIGDALALHGLASGDVSPGHALCAVGGLEIAALTGAIITAAQSGTAVLIDGFIVSVSALLATRLNPSCRPYLVFSHASAEQGHKLVLDALHARPLLSLDLRLGEGSGAALALPLVRMACALHNRMATFAEAAVPDRKS